MKQQPFHASCHKPRREFEFSLWMRKVIMELNSRMIERQKEPGNVCLWQQPKLSQSSRKSFPLEHVFPSHRTKADFLTAPWTSHLSHQLHPFTPTWVCGCCVRSPYIPGILHLLQKGDQVRLRDHKACSSEKGIFVLLEIHKFPTNMYLGEKRTDGWMLIQPRGWFLQILYWKHPYNTNKYIKIRSWDSGQVLQGES